MSKAITFLKLYVDPAWRRSGNEVYSPLMFPFWGNPVPESHRFAKELYDHYAYDTNYYGITNNLAEADMVFPPYRYDWLMRRHKDLWQECVATTRRANKPLFIDGVGDGEVPIGIENAYVLRIGGYRFVEARHKPFKFIPPYMQWDPAKRVEIPTQADDLLERCAGGAFTARAYRPGQKPVVGFAGMSHTSLGSLGKRAMLEEMVLYLRGTFLDSSFHTMRRGVLWRTAAIESLRRSDRIEPNFLIRNFYSASTSTAKGDIKTIQKEMVDVLLASDYCLDVRGFANASVRLYEILSLGRIPIVLDTERILPFADEVDYRAFSLIVDFGDIKKLPDIIADFHAQLTPEKFEAMQHAARDAYVNHFRIDAQMRHILRAINEYRGA